MVLHLWVSPIQKFCVHNVPYPKKPAEKGIERVEGGAYSTSSEAGSSA
jgi:hypothetical protein